MAILFSSFIIYAKSLKYDFAGYKKSLSILWCSVWPVVSVIGKTLISPLLFRVLFCVGSVILIIFLTETKPDTVIAAYLFSFGISYVLYYIVSVTIAVIASPFARSEYAYGLPENLNKPLYLMIYFFSSVFQLILSFLLFRIRRFKNGFPFLFRKYAIVIALIVAGTILALVTWMKVYFEIDDYTYTPLLILGVTVVGVGIFIWVRLGIKTYYRQKMKERGIEILEQELAEKEHEINKLTGQNNILRAANHKTTHRIAALDKSVSLLACKLQTCILSAEMSEELTVTLEDIKRLSQEYQNDINQIKTRKPIPSTKIKMLDDMFGYFSEQCSANGIDFNLRVTGSIPYMTEHLITQSKLETMIGDHIQDAIIAVNASGSPFRSILVLLGLVDDCYELTFYDSGIPFNADTLMKLGTGHITTHTDTGGSGIGFMTTFESMRESGASLIINEMSHSNFDYSKSITIRFDGKNQYIIKTHRADEFDIKSDRYVVIGLG